MKMNFKKKIGIVRIDGIFFEIFSDPEIDTRYYFGTTDNLEKIFKCYK